MIITACLYFIFRAMTLIYFMTCWGVNFHDHWRGKALCSANNNNLINFRLGDLFNCESIMEHNVDSHIGAVSEDRRVLYLGESLNLPVDLRVHPPPIAMTFGYWPNKWDCFLQRVSALGTRWGVQISGRSSDMTIAPWSYKVEWIQLDERFWKH